MVKIIQEGHPTLRQIAKPVVHKDIGSKKLDKILTDMKKALHGESDGVAIAAPQIGVSLRIFIVSKKVFHKDILNDESLISQYANQDVVFINPEFLKISRDKKLMSEGCLSVRPLYGKVRRSTKATIKALDENGQEFTISGSGLLAHIFQHETDHLNGILFIDKAKDVHEQTPEEKIR